MPSGSVWGSPSVLKPSRPDCGGSDTKRGIWIQEYRDAVLVAKDDM